MRKRRLVLICLLGFVTYVIGYLHGNTNGYVRGHDQGIKIGIIKQMINEGYSLEYIEEEYDTVLEDDDMLDEIRLQS